MIDLNNDGLVRASFSFLWSRRRCFTASLSREDPGMVALIPVACRVIERRSEDAGDCGRLCDSMARGRAGGVWAGGGRPRNRPRSGGGRGRAARDASCCARPTNGFKSGIRAVVAPGRGNPFGAALHLCLAEATHQGRSSLLAADLAAAVRPPIVPRICPAFIARALHAGQCRQVAREAHRDQLVLMSNATSGTRPLM